MLSLFLINTVLLLLALTNGFEDKVLAPDEVKFFKNNNTVSKVLSHLKTVQQDLSAKPWVLMDRPALDPTQLAEAVRIKHRERDDMLKICQSSLVRKMQGRTGEIIERPGWRVANDAEVRGGCIATNCPEVAPFVCSMQACKAYCCSIHGPDHHLHATWATAELLTTQRDQRKAAMAVVNPRGRGRGARGGARGGGRTVGGRSVGGQEIVDGNVATELGAGRLGVSVSDGQQPMLQEESAGRGRGRGRGRSGGSGRGGRLNQQVASVNAEAESTIAMPPDEVNPLAILAGLLRSHPNLLSQIVSIGSNDDSAENVLDEWIF